LRKGDPAGGNADLAAAQAIEPGIAEEFALFGVSVVEPKTTQPASDVTANCAAAETHWKTADEIKTRAVYQDHLSRFPNCDFATLAKLRIDALK
jgi:hypothetical protein